MEERWMLKPDDDGHWYLVKATAEDAFERYVWEDGPWPEEGVVNINGPVSVVTFLDPLIQGEEVA